MANGEEKKKEGWKKMRLAACRVRWSGCEDEDQASRGRASRISYGVKLEEGKGG